MHSSAYVAVTVREVTQLLEGVGRLAVDAVTGDQQPPQPGVDDGGPGVAAHEEALDRGHRRHLTAPDGLGVGAVEVEAVGQRLVRPVPQHGPKSTESLH